MIEVYRGSPHAHECDEMGHMNVRFYLSKLMEGLGVFCHKSFLGHAFRTNAPSTIRIRDIHVRFLREAPAGSPFFMRAAVLSSNSTSAHLYLQLDHLSGEPCAAYQVKFEHIDIHTRQTFSWSSRTQNSFSEFSLGDEAMIAPLSIDPLKAAGPVPEMKDAEALSLSPIGIGMVSPEHCNIFGDMKIEHFIGRISEAAPNLINGLNTDIKRSPSNGDSATRIGTAALEYRFVFHSCPTAGDAYALYSGNAPDGFNAEHDKTYGLTYWFMDQSTRKAFATAQATLIQFDLGTRKSVSLSQATKQAMKETLSHDMWV